MYTSSSSEVLDRISDMTVLKSEPRACAKEQLMSRESESPGWMRLGVAVMRASWVTLMDVQVTGFTGEVEM